MAAESAVGTAVLAVIAGVAVAQFEAAAAVAAIVTAAATRVLAAIVGGSFAVNGKLVDQCYMLHCCSEAYIHMVSQTSKSLLFGLVDIVSWAGEWEFDV